MINYQLSITHMDKELSVFRGAIITTKVWLPDLDNQLFFDHFVIVLEIGQ